MSIKLFAINSFSLQFFDFVSSLKQTVNRNWVHFTFFRSKQFKSTFFWISSTGTQSILSLENRAFFQFFFMNDDFWYRCFKYITIICYLFKPRFRFWINGCAWNKKIQVLRHSLFRTSYLSCTDMGWGWRGIGIDRATIQNFVYTFRGGSVRRKASSTSANLLSPSASWVMKAWRISCKGTH